MNIQRQRIPEPVRLSKREEQVLFAIMRGQSVKQTAHALGITESTIKHYRGLMMEKLGARNTPHAVTLAFRHGLVPDDLKPPAEIKLPAGLPFWNMTGRVV